MTSLGVLNHSNLQKCHQQCAHPILALDLGVIRAHVARVTKVGARVGGREAALEVGRGTDRAADGFDGMMQMARRGGRGARRT